MFDVFVEQNEYCVYRLDEGNQPSGKSLLRTFYKDKAVGYATLRNDLSSMSLILKDFNPSQPRDGEGQWTDSGGGSDGSASNKKPHTNDDDPLRNMSQEQLRKLAASMGIHVAPAAASNVPSKKPEKEGGFIDLSDESEVSVTDRFFDTTLKPNKSQIEGIEYYLDISGNQKINSALRTGQELDPKSKKAAAQLDKSIAGSTLPENMNLYRGYPSYSKRYTRFVDDVKSGKLKPGMVIKDDGYSSTTADKNVASDKFSEGGVVFKIKAPKGSNGLHVNAALDKGYGKRHSGEFRDEEEVILPRGSRIKVEKINVVDDPKFGKRYEVEATLQHKSSTKAYISPRPVPLFQRHKEGITIFKGRDGLRFMFIVTSNSYQDREEETITTKALNRYVDAAWAVEGKCLPRNWLELWHTKAPIGDILWCDMEGPFLIELAKERPNRPIKLKLHNRVIRTTVKAIWDAIEALDIRWGASHGFNYPENAKTKDGTYHYIAKFETSILPLNAASNPYTYAEIIDMNARDKFLEDLTGFLGIGSKARKGVQAVKGKLDKQGIQHKAKSPAKQTTKGLLEDLTAKIDEIIGEITDGDTSMLRDKLLAALAETLTTAAAAVPAEAAAAEIETEYMEGDPVDEETQPDAALMEKQLKTAMQLNTRLINSMEQLADDNAATRDAVLAIAETVKSLKDTAKLPDQLETLTSRIKGMEDRFRGGPRRASQDTTPEALVEDDKLTEKVKEAMTRFEEPLPGLKLRVEE